MLERDARIPAEILRSHQAMRQWAADVRNSGQRRRPETRADRSQESAADLSGFSSRPRPPLPMLATTDPAMPSMGDVQVTELFTILVDQHGFTVVDAVRALATGLLIAGYPMDYDRVCAADAFDIVEWSLRHR